MKRFLSALLLGTLALALPLAAQQQGGGGNNRPNQQPNQPNRPLYFPVWKAELPGGSYLIARNAINGVSIHTYILNSVARVTEVNISTGSNFQPRFYYIENLGSDVVSGIPGAQTALDAAKGAVESTANDAGSSDQPWAKVNKTYPTTTHAGTIEYRLDSLDQLQKLFGSVERTWLTGKGEIYTPEGIKNFDPNEELKNKDADSDGAGEGGPGSGAGGAN